MSNYVNDLWPGSPQDKASPSTGRSSRLSSRSSSNHSSSRSSGAHASSRSPSRSRRNRSRSVSRRRHQRKYRRYSRSYSRSRSRSRSRGRRHHHHHHAHHAESSRSRRRSPSRRRSRSRSRSRDRSYYRRAYALTRGRRYYGFGRTVYPEEHRMARDRSRTRSRSRTPFRLTDKDRMELLEIAKANAAKALGTTNIDLPASLRTDAKETSISNTKYELSEKLTKDGTKSPSEKSSEQRSIAFSSNVNSVAKPVLEKAANSTTEEISSRSAKIDKKKSPYELWLPV